MLEFIQGVSESVLSANLPVTFRVEEGSLVSSVPDAPGTKNTMPLHKATSRAQGNAVGENLVTAALG